MDGISVIVCCFNSANRLPQTLDHIWRQQTRNLRVELVLVDNRCTDDTVCLTRRLHQNSGCDILLNVIREERPGQLHARLAGIKAASFETIVFCDDDNWLAHDYCQIAYQILQTNPQVAIAGGSIAAVTEIAPPAWFHPVSEGWAIGEINDQGQIPGEAPCVYGAGMVLRKSALSHLLETGFKFICFGRAGTALGGGDDSELCRALCRIGYHVWRDHRLRMSHWIPKERLTWAYATRLWEGFGASDIAEDAKSIQSAKNQFLLNKLRLWWVYQGTRAFIKLFAASQHSPILNGSQDGRQLGWYRLLGRTKCILKIRSSYHLLISERIRWLNDQYTITSRITAGD